LGMAFYCGSYAFCREAQSSSGKIEGSIYSYSDNDIPEVFFFPKEKARWDGNKVTMSEWYMLTDLQKEKFVSEYMGELKKQYQGTMEALGLNYLKALDLFSFYANEKAKSEPSTKVIDLLLKGQEKSGAI
ncbi:MAG: hypothetical protein WCY36_06465, partial [Candidatus Omnitrophota bacterium]